MNSINGSAGAPGGSWPTDEEREDPRVIVQEQSVYCGCACALMVFQKLGVQTLTTQDELCHELEKVLEEAARSVRRLQRIDDPADSKSRADNIAGELSKLVGTYARDVESRFDQWAGNLGAVFHDVPADCLHEVLDQYFAGQAPFKEVKNREDFPDAFIWHTVRQIAGAHQLYMVCADNNLRDALTELPNVDVFENLDALIESEIVQELFPDNFIRRRSDEIIRLFEDNQRFLEQELLNLLTAELTTSHISYRDDDSADITDVSEPLRPPSSHGIQVEFS